MWIAAVVLVALLLYMLRRSPMTWQAASSGTVFWVKRAPGQELVADRLEVLTKTLRDLLDRTDDLYPNDPRIANVRARWNGRLSETETPGEIAFSMNKNDVYVCIRAPSTGLLEDVNTSIYVLLHEIAHIATNSYGHTQEFWENFRWLLEVAEKLGVYTYQDFDTVQTTFCGHNLGNNVLRCVKRKQCPSLLPKAQN
jgi:hypothetical protein